MNAKTITLVLLLFAVPLTGRAEPADVNEVAASGTYEEAADAVRQQLDASTEELRQLREQMKEELVPLQRRLSRREQTLLEVRREYQEVSRDLDTTTLELGNLRTDIERLKQESTYLSNLLSEYLRSFESRLHIAELQRYRDVVERARLAADNTSLSPREVFAEQVTLVETSLDRLDEALGGYTFDGTAVDPTGTVQQGTFALIGPTALFRADDGQVVGTAEQHVGSLEPAVVAFGHPADAEAAAALILNHQGRLPLDPTLGNAHKIESTRQTLVEHIRKGGPVMVPILALAAAALGVALVKWVSLAVLPKPSRRQIDGLLQTVARGDEAEARAKAGKLKGPVGTMLTAGIAHLREPRELVEEVMYEQVLATRLKLHRWLPFIAVAAASAPLLGLLGTVTGIINTFKLITVFGSGDVKMLSGGISEALITTEFGLIVAIPSLLIHAFLSRRAKGVVNEMEKAGVALMNQITRTPPHRPSVQRDSVTGDDPEGDDRTVKRDDSAADGPTGKQDGPTGKYEGSTGKHKGPTGDDAAGANAMAAGDVVKD